MQKDTTPAQMTAEDTSFMNEHITNANHRSVFKGLPRSHRDYYMSLNGQFTDDFSAYCEATSKRKQEINEEVENKISQLNLQKESNTNVDLKSTENLKKDDSPEKRMLLRSMQAQLCIMMGIPVVYEKLKDEILQKVVGKKMNDLLRVFFSLFPRLDNSQEDVRRMSINFALSPIFGVPTSKMKEDMDPAELSAMLISIEVREMLFPESENLSPEDIRTRFKTFVFSYLAEKLQELSGENSNEIRNRYEPYYDDALEDLKEIVLS